MKRYLASLAILALVFVGQSIALHDLFILRWPAFHVIMHIAGGVGLGLLVSALISSLKPDLKDARLAVVLAVLALGLLWEWFEARYGLTGYRFGTLAYYLDTAKDLFNDMIGGTVAALLVVHPSRTDD